MRFIFFILLLFLAVSCKIDKKDQNKLTKKTEYSYLTGLDSVGEIIKLNINNRIINRSICLQPYMSKDSTQYLFYLSGYTNLICVFNIDSERLENVIELKRRGPNGVGDVNGFKVLSFDSIYVTSNYRRKLVIVNQEGEIISTVDYSKYQQNQMVFAPTCRSLENMRLEIKDSKMYVPFYPGYDQTNYKKIQPSEVRFIAELDTSAKSAELVKVGFPDGYWDNEYYPPFFGFFLYANHFYVNYMYDDRIATSDDSQNWNFHYVKSKYVKVKKGKYKFLDGVLSHYSKLVADPYRKVFYRFVVWEQSRSENKTSRDLKRYPTKFSIMILDKSLNVIGETIFPRDVYDMNGYFINKDGLYLSLSNPFNPNYNADLLEFQLFKLVTHEK